MLRAGFGANVSGSPTTTGVGSPSRPRPWAAGCWPRLRPLPHPLRCCAGTATSSQPSTMAPRIGVQADLPRRKTSVSSWYVWHGRTRHADIRACRAHSRTSDMNLGATPSRGPSPSTVSRLPRSGARVCRGAPSSRLMGALSLRQIQEHAWIFALAYVVFCMVTTRPPKTIVEPAALGTVANTNTKLLIYGLFQKGRVLAQDGTAPNLTLRCLGAQLR